MKVGDLVEYVVSRSVGIVVRSVNDDDNLHLIGYDDNSELWWVQFIDDSEPDCIHENEMYILQKGK